MLMINIFLKIKSQHQTFKGFYPGFQFKHETHLKKKLYIYIYIKLGSLKRIISNVLEYHSVSLGSICHCILPIWTNFYYSNKSVCVPEEKL